MPGLMRGPNKDERREMDNKHPQGGGRPCCFFQSLVKPPVWLNLQDQRGDDIQTQGERQGRVFIWEDVCLKIFLTFL